MPDLYAMPGSHGELYRVDVNSIVVNRSVGYSAVRLIGRPAFWTTKLLRIGTLSEWRRAAVHNACDGKCIPFRCKLCKRIVGGCIGCGDEFDERYGPACDDCAVTHPAWLEEERPHG